MKLVLPLKELSLLIDEGDIVSASIGSEGEVVLHIDSEQDTEKVLHIDHYGPGEGCSWNLEEA